MNKKIKIILASLFLLVIYPLSICFTGCSSTYTVTFMKASNLSYYNDTVRCIYIKDFSIEISKGQVIGTEESPNPTFGDGRVYKFDGWFTDKEYNYKWDLNKDEVKTNITLYPKYIHL